MEVVAEARRAMEADVVFGKIALDWYGGAPSAGSPNPSEC